MSEHYFSETPAGEFKTREIEVVLAGQPHRVLTAGGVFSPEHLDGGTAVLLRALESGQEALEGQGSDRPAILDLGCGWGALALSAALHHPDAEVWAVDVNERARDLTARNAALLGLNNVRTVAPDEVPAEVQFTAIHSNPPIRVGKQVLHEMLRSWLPRLVPGGEAHLVVAKHLGAESLQRWLTSEFTEFEVARVARERGFHVIRVARQADPAAE